MKKYGNTSKKNTNEKNILGYKYRHRLAYQQVALGCYAVKLEHGIFVITGGAIKLTFKMQDREHTKEELRKMEQVRNYLLNENIIDNESFTEFVNTI